jgi:hypothetical protein
MNSNHSSSPYNSDWICAFPLYTSEKYVQAPEADASLVPATGIQSSGASLRHEQNLPSDNLVISPTIVQASDNDDGAIYRSHLNTDQEVPNPSSTSEISWVQNVSAPVIPEAVEPKVDMENIVVMDSNVYGMSPFTCTTSPGKPNTGTDIKYTGYEKDPNDLPLKPTFMVAKPKGKCTCGVLFKKQRKKSYKVQKIDPNIEDKECFTAGVNLCGKAIPFQIRGQNIDRSVKRSEEKWRGSRYEILA